VTIETVTYISDFNVTYPVDNDQTNHPESLGDDHIRNYKTGWKGTFPNVTGAVQASHTELNYLSDVTSAVQTQLNNKTASYQVTVAGTVTLSAARIQLYTPNTSTVDVNLPTSPTVGDIVFVVNPRSWTVVIPKNSVTLNNASQNLSAYPYSVAMCIYGPAGNWTVDPRLGD